MQIHEINDLSNARALSLLKDGLSKITDEQIIKNYHPDFAHISSNLFYILEHGRYGKGKGTYYVVEEQGEYVCSAGWNEYEIEPTIAFALTRMFVAPKYRGTYVVAKYILDKSLLATEKYEKVWLSVNEYNKTLYTWFVRANENKKTSLFNDWPDTYRNFKPIGQRIIYNTPQYVVELERKNDK